MRYRIRSVSSNGSTWMSEARAEIAFSTSRLTSRTTGASNAMSRSWLTSSSPSPAPDSSSMPSTMRCSGVAAPSYARSIASVIASSVLTTKRIVWIPVAWRRSSLIIGLSGSDVATVSTSPSTLNGHTPYWRRYFGERFFTTGRVDGRSSRET